MSIQIDYFYQIIQHHIQITDDMRQFAEKLNIPKIEKEANSFNLEPLPVGDHVSTRLLINDFQVRLTKTDKKYLTLSLSNQNGMINAKIWDNNGDVDRYLHLLEKYRVFDIEGKVDAYNNIKSLVISKMIPVEQALDPFILLPFPDISLEDLTFELLGYIHQLNEPYKSFSLQTIAFFWDDFVLAPAAKGHHHNYLGGLLKHTVGLMRFVTYVKNHDKSELHAIFNLINHVERAYKIEIFNQFKDETHEKLIWRDSIDHLYRMMNQLSDFEESDLNYDELFTAILYHDMGKLLEYDFTGKSYDAFSFLYPYADRQVLSERNQGGIEMDSLGVLVGHIPYGVQLLQQMLLKTKTPLSITSIHRLNHMILCHHGLPEWGSAFKRPLTAEGILIHIVDYLDSRYENVTL